MNTMRAHAAHFIKFIVVGCVGTGVNYALFYLLLSQLHWHYEVCSAIGFVVGVAVSYPLNKLWTYGDKGKVTAGLTASYFAVYLFSLGLNLLVLYVLTGRLGIDARIANAVSIVITTCPNFIGTKFIVFRKRI